MSRQLGEKIRVRVLRRHITKGMAALRGGDWVRDCVVAQALKEKFPRTSVLVGAVTASVGREEYTISQKGVHLISRVCDGKAIKPTTITLIRDDDQE